jgi:hypothetical protein
MSHDAQQELQQRSLRNVRALLDKLEAEAQAERRTRKWIAFGLAAFAAVLSAAFYFGMKANKGESRTVVSTPASRGEATFPPPPPAPAPSR